MEGVLREAGAGMGPKSGKKWARKGKKDKKRGRDERPSNANQENGGWLPNKRPGVPLMRSPVFEAYYRAQKVVSEEEWDQFMAVLQEPLAASFRINLDCDYADIMLGDFEKFSGTLESQDGTATEAIRRLEWFKDGRAYQLGIDRRSLRRNENLETFHEFVKMHTDIGTITRQEAVSMIPPIVLDIQSHHKVLDMCAAPGSKTSQMLEALVRGGVVKKLKEPEGFIVANDADTNRAYMLVHQCKRLSTANLCVTTHQAQHFPGLPGYGRGVGPFDRVLCDVPCSGDGTVRKTLNIWRQWTPASGMGLHFMQLQIAKRGAALLAVGGLMVYSTCSLNPIEDEAVVVELLRDSQGSLELIDGRSLLPGLKCRPGLYDWLVVDTNRDGQQNGKKGGDKPKPAAEGEAVPAEGGAASMEVEGKEEKEGEEKKEAAPLTVEEQLKQAGMRILQSPEDFPKDQRKWRPTVFPPTHEEAQRLGLEKCMRVVPHDQNTGGFFIALLRKLGPSPTGGKANWTPGQPTSAEGEGAEEAGAEEEEEATADAKDGGAADEGGAAAKPAKKSYNKVSNFVPQATFEPLPEESWIAIRDFYGLKEDFPRDQLLLRNGSSKSVTYLAKSLHDNLAVGKDSRHQLVHLGVKIFFRDSKDKDTCPFRVVQEGLPFVIDYMQERVVELQQSEFCSLVHHGFLYINACAEPAMSAIADLKVGGFVASYRPAPEEGASPKRFDVVVWRGNGNKLNLMASKFDTTDIVCRLKAFKYWVEPPPVKEKKKEEEKAEEEAEGGDGEEGEEEEGGEEEGEADGEGEAMEVTDEQS